MWGGAMAVLQPRRGGGTCEHAHVNLLKRLGLGALPWSTCHGRPAMGTLP